jgi:hypothetical protein
MAEVIGTISACIGLADRIIALVEKFASAKVRIQTIANDVTLLNSILSQLQQVLKPDPDAPYTAVRLTYNGLRNSLTAVQHCKDIFTRICNELEIVTRDKKVKEYIDLCATLPLDWMVRTFWLFKSSTITELREELNRAKQDVMLSLSVNQLSLAKQPSQLHPLDQQELDRLRVTVELLWANQRAQTSLPDYSLPPYSLHASGNTKQPPDQAQGAFGSSASGGLNAFVATGNPGDKGIGGLDSSGPPPSPTPRRNRIDRVDRGLISTQVLSQQKRRWLNDPVSDLL